jgi:hypothetical protein
LVSAFHFESFLISIPSTTWLFLGETGDYRKLSGGWQTLSVFALKKSTPLRENSGL